MIRFPEIRSHLTLALGACGMAVALASVPHAAAERPDLLDTVVDFGWPCATASEEWMIIDVPRYSGDIWREDAKSDSQSIANNKSYLEILTCPSDDTNRAGMPLSYVTCTGTGLGSKLPDTAVNVTSASAKYVVFPVESGVSGVEVQ